MFLVVFVLRCGSKQMCLTCFTQQFRFLTTCQAGMGGTVFNNVNCLVDLRS